jgi:hypothetical protein
VEPVASRQSRNRDGTFNGARPRKPPVKLPSDAARAALARVLEAPSLAEQLRVECEPLAKAVTLPEAAPREIGVASETAYHLFRQEALAPEMKQLMFECRGLPGCVAAAPALGFSDGGSPRSLRIIADGAPANCRAFEIQRAIRITGRLGRFPAVNSIYDSALRGNPVAMLLGRSSTPIVAAAYAADCRPETAIRCIARGAVGNHELDDGTVVFARNGEPGEMAEEALSMLVQHKEAQGARILARALARVDPTFEGFLSDVVAGQRLANAVISSEIGR